MAEVLKESYEFDKTNIREHHYFPPYVPFDEKKLQKFRKYLITDEIHECARDETYKLWIDNDDYNSDSSEENFDDEDEEQKKIREMEKTDKKENKYNILSYIPCENNCFYFRNIDRLRISQTAVDEVLNLYEFEQLKNIDINFYMINNWKLLNKEEKFSSKNLVWSKINIYNEPKQGELIRFMRNIHGEKIAFYFLWVIFLLKRFVYLNIVTGICFTVYYFQSYFGEISVGKSGMSVLDFVFFFHSIFVGFFSSILIKSWKGKELLYSTIWGTKDYETYEGYRDEYQKGANVVRFAFNKKLPIRSAWFRYIKQFLSFLVLCIIAAANVALMYGCFQIKIERSLLLKSLNKTSDNFVIVNDTENIENKKEKDDKNKNKNKRFKRLLDFENFENFDANADYENLKNYFDINAKYQINLEPYMEEENKEINSLRFLNTNNTKINESNNKTNSNNTDTNSTSTNSTVKPKKKYYPVRWNRPGESEIFSSYRPILSALLIGLLIEIFRSINSFVANKLTLWENHEKQSKSDRSYISKYILLEFINNFSFAFYILIFRVKVFLKVF